MYHQFVSSCCLRERFKKMSDTCSLFPPFGDLWPSYLLPSQNHVICEQRQFYFFLCKCNAFSFFFFLPLAETSSTVWNDSGQSRYSCFVPDIAGKAFNLSLSSVILTVAFSRMPFISLRKMPSISSFLNVLLPLLLL